jgi:hypothetical protein
MITGSINADRRRDGLEKHAVTVLVGIITALLVWIGYTTQQTAIGVARLEVQISGVSQNSERINRLESRLLDVERER